MYAFVDRNIPAITHRHNKRAALESVIELFKLEGLIVDEMDPSSFEDLTELEMKLIYTNMTGIAPVGLDDRYRMISWMRGFCFCLYESVIEGFEHPLLNKMLDLKPFKTAAPRTPTLPPTPSGESAPASATQAAAPRSTTQATPEAPKAGSKTGRVWEIAESLLAAQGGHSDFKSLRKDIISACEAEGINSSTASVQFGKWKSTKV